MARQSGLWPLHCLLWWHETHCWFQMYPQQAPRKRVNPATWSLLRTRLRWAMCHQRRQWQAPRGWIYPLSFQVFLWQEYNHSPGTHQWWGDNLLIRCISILQLLWNPRGGGSAPVCWTTSQKRLKWGPQGFMVKQWRGRQPQSLRLSVTRGRTQSQATHSVCPSTVNKQWNQSSDIGIELIFVYSRTQKQRRLDIACSHT